MALFKRRRPYPNWRLATVSTGVPALGFVSSAGDYGESETAIIPRNKANYPLRGFDRKSEGSVWKVSEVCRCAIR